MGFAVSKFHLFKQSQPAVDGGIDFFVVGDYGWVQDMGPSDGSFDLMSKIAGEEDIDFFVTVGDNIYPKDGSNPTTAEFKLMMDLFTTRDNLKNIPINVLRGNHDTYFDSQLEVNLVNENPHWYLPSNFYYARLVDIGNGKKAGFLHIDGDYLLCSNYRYSDESYANDFKECYSKKFTGPGDEMVVWLLNVLDEWNKDPSIVWKFNMNHYHLFGKWYLDAAYLVDNYMPLLMDNGFDFFINGHEHTMLYANYLTKDKAAVHQRIHDSVKTRKQSKNCEMDDEWFYGTTAREHVYTKGDAIHQVTTGTTGWKLYGVCED